MVLVHSVFRWLILLLFIIVILKHLISSKTNKPYTKQDKLLDIILISCLDLMLLIGLYLFFTHPIIMEVFKTPRLMSIPGIRKIAIEHPILMILAIIFAHIAGAQRKKNIPDVAKKHKRIAIFFIISFALILLGIPKWS